MKIIISPAKQMKSNEDTYFPLTSPLYLEKAKKLVGHLSKLSYQQLKTVLNCSDSLAKKAFENYQTIDFDHNPSMAILSYNGIQYQYMFLLMKNLRIFKITYSFYPDCMES